SLFSNILNRFHVPSVSFTLKVLITILIMRIAAYVSSLLPSLPRKFFSKVLVSAQIIEALGGGSSAIA
ncbi:MAG: hypothetical protein V7L06_00670, partial [Nostoc sp.]